VGKKFIWSLKGLDCLSAQPNLLINWYPEMFAWENSGSGVQLTNRPCLLLRLGLGARISVYVPSTRRSGVKQCSCNCVMTNIMQMFLIYLSIHFCLTCFGLPFSPSSGAGVQFRQWFKSTGYGLRARALIPYPGQLNYYRNYTPASEDGLKESPKHVRQK
jgi:hypothetical protein